MKSIELLLKIITGNYSELWCLSILRYSSSRYRIFNNLLIDNLFWIIIFPIFWLFQLPKSNFWIKKNNKIPTKIIFQVNDKKIYESFFSNIINKLEGQDYLIEGDGFNIPIIKNDLSIAQIIYLTIVFIIIWPLITLFSLFYLVNYHRVLIRSTFIYFKTLNHFTRHPCDNYFTYQDNSCSAPFYLAFKKIGGKNLIAFQNGIRNKKEGIDGSCFDCLFAMNQFSVDLYKECKSIIKNFEIIGSMNIYNNPKLIEKKPISIDILFIDQGFPSTDLEKYLELTTFTFNDLKRYLADIKKFSAKFPNLKIGYQLRPYPEKFSHILEDAIKWFEGTSVEIFYKNKTYDSYKKIQESKIVVTIDSTIGLESLSLGKTTLFTNHGIKKDFEILPGSKLQLRCGNYKVFEENIILALEDKFSEEFEKTTYYAPLVSPIISRDIVLESLKKLI